MASFDLQTFAKVTGTGTSPFAAMGMSFGLPSCMLSLAAGALNLLPGNILVQMDSAIAEGRAAANNLTKEIFKKLMLNTGIIEFDTEEGILKFKNGTSWGGIDNNGLQGLANLQGFIGAVTGGISQLYANYQNITNQLDAIKDCFEKWNELQMNTVGNSATTIKGALNPGELEAYLNATYSADKARMDETLDFMQQCDFQRRVIGDILYQRSQDPSLEPCFSDSAELDPYLSGTNFTRCAVTDPTIEPEEDVFRLTFGPPIVEGGYYVLTNDGLYYDSQSGGLDPIYLAISGIVPVGDAWKYDYDPNLGGKGQAVSIKSLNKFTDNIFDPERIDDSIGLQHYYNEDHFLSVLLQQRDKHVYDLSADLVSFIGEFGEESSIVKNQRQLIISNIASHNSKVNRRKKQIEVAVKAPQIYGDETAPQFSPGEVPINDFGYLEQYNLGVDLEKQKALIFHQAEVTGIVLPLQPKYVESQAKPASMSISHLNVPTVGKGSILYSPSSTQAGTVLSLNDQIESDGLFAIYNFLETTLELPSSLDFPTTNCATENMYNNGQLVGASKQAVFVSGLGIPYFEGIVKNKDTDTAAASAMGSYFKLPDTSEFRDLTYSPSGFSMECWVHVPNIMDGEVGWLSSTTSSLTKVLLGSENVGAQVGASSLDHTGAERDLDYLENNRGEQFVRGMVCGFTRDRRITQTTGYSNANYDNDPASSLSFFIAPTQARDLSSASFINNDECQETPTFYNMKVDLSATDFGNVSSQFVLVDITVDPPNNEISFYADGSHIATSSISTVFGVEPNIAPNLPTFKKNNSFEYSSTTVDGPSTLQGGPRLNQFYTPWIVGGGYTDGMYQYGNFMGGDRSGIVSGFRGHIGSLKFYSRPLDKEEVLQNYKAQQGFFKNIKI